MKTFAFLKRLPFAVGLSGTLVVAVVFLFSQFAKADDMVNIGSGNPGLKVIHRPRLRDVAVIIHEDPEWPIGGSIGPYMTNETTHVIIDDRYYFKNLQSELLSRDGGIPSQLFPFATNSAFTDESGIEWGWERWSNVWARMSSDETGYVLENGNLTAFTNVQQEARARYHLSNDDLFLGFLDNRVFFCKIRTRPSKIFWRDETNQKEYYYQAPRSVRNVFGVTKALSPDKDVGFVILRPTPLQWPPWDNFFLPPYDFDFIQISFSKGKLVQPPG